MLIANHCTYLSTTTKEADTCPKPSHCNQPPPASLDRALRHNYFTNKLINHMVKHAMDHLSATFAALADPTRRAILARLAQGETSVTELAAPFEMTLPAVTKHLKVLERAGLVIRGREAQWRPCRLEARPLQEAVGWMEQYRRFWEERLDRLEDYLRELQAQEAGENAKQPAETATPAVETPEHPAPAGNARNIAGNIKTKEPSARERKNGRQTK